MLLDWVQLREEAPGFVPLEHERVLHTVASTRTGLALEPKGNAPTKHVLRGAGRLFVTTQRMLLVVAAAEGAAFRLFLILYRQVQLHEVEELWFGPNRWRGTFVCSDYESGLLKGERYDVVVTFPDGGMVEFVRAFAAQWTRARSDVDPNDDLPRYTE